MSQYSLYACTRTRNCVFSSMFHPIVYIICTVYHSLDIPHARIQLSNWLTAFHRVCWLIMRGGSLIIYCHKACLSDVLFVYFDMSSFAAVSADASDVRVWADAKDKQHVQCVRKCPECRCRSALPEMADVRNEYSDVDKRNWTRKPDRNPGKIANLMTVLTHASWWTL